MQVPGTRKTVDGIMKAFNKTITDLTTVAERSEADKTALMEQKVEIDRQIVTAGEEASRARQIAKSLTDLIGTE